MWTLRKLYGGSLGGGTGGILPPNDPRLADLTEEQIELDLLLFLEDHPELKKKAEAYEDTEYDRAMKEELGEVVDTTEAYQEGFRAVEQGAPLPNDWEEVPFEEE